MLRDQLFDLRRDLRELRVVFSVEHRSSDQFADGVELFGIEAARSARSRTDANATRDERRARFVRDRVLVHGKADTLEQLLSILARDVRGIQIDQAKVVVGAA